MSNVLWSDADTLACGTSTAPWQARGVSIDSRSLCKGDLFVALTGQRVDGHDFLEQAKKKGAAAAMVARPVGSSSSSSLPLVEVEDSLQGLQGLARLARRRSQARIVAVTGSSGKTGTKDMIDRLFSQHASSFCSRGNLNNHIGMALSLARLPADRPWAVFEMGMNHSGEIAALTRILEPHWCVITNVSPAHIGHFQTLSDIALAKAEIFTHGKAQGAILLRESPFYPLLVERARAASIGKVISFGCHPEADWRIQDCRSKGEGIQARIMHGSDSWDIRMEQGGRHHMLNAAAAMATVHACGVSIKDAEEVLSNISPTAGRGGHRDIRVHGGSVQVLDESYNANPDSMQCAMDVLASMPLADKGRRIAVLGDMLELGNHARVLHLALRSHLERNGVDLVLTTGHWMAMLQGALPGAMQAGHYPDVDALAERLQQILRPGDVVMIKGSARHNLSRIIDHLSISAEARDAL